MTNAQALEVLTKIFKDVDNLKDYNVDVNRVYILDYIKSNIDSIKTGKKPQRSQLVEIKNFIDKFLNDNKKGISQVFEISIDTAVDKLNNIGLMMWQGIK